MANDKHIQAAKKFRKALQVCLSTVELTEEDVADLEGVFDEFDPDQKYKKGEICIYNGANYICLKTTKKGTSLTPDKDAEHWKLLGTSTPSTGGEGEGGETTDPGTEPEQPEPTGDTYDPEATYNKGDTVIFNGVTYECGKNNVQGVEPGTDAKSWTVVE